jgi:type 1 glutamine amidotransferase
MVRAAWRRWLPLAGMLMCSCASDTSPQSPGNPLPSTPGGQPPRVLIVTHTEGFRHSSIPLAESTLTALGQQSGLFTVTFCRSAGDVTRMLTPAGLAGVDAVVFANTTGSLPIPDIGAVLRWIADGHGFAGMHSAADTYHDRPDYLEMLGNEFRTHGEHATVDAIVENRSHPASSPLGSRWRVLDEIYLFTRPNRNSVTMLLSLDRYPDDGSRESGQPGDLPLAWAKSYGRGRVFYTALGHREELWQDSLYQQHILGGIRWVLGR